MGYFRRKLDRGRARAESERLLEEQAELGPWVPIDPSWAAPPRADPYLRFSAREAHVDSGRRTGIFQATNLLDEERLEPQVREELEHELDWFSEHLTVPRLSEERAIFLFRSRAHDLIQRLWRLARLLGDHGLTVELQSCSNPGKVVYEDELQVAVIPWASEPRL